MKWRRLVVEELLIFIVLNFFNVIEIVFEREVFVGEIFVFDFDLFDCIICMEFLVVLIY